MQQLIAGEHLIPVLNHISQKLHLATRQVDAHSVLHSFGLLEIDFDIAELVSAHGRGVCLTRPSQQRLHSREQLLPEISPNLREFARKEMEKAGVRIVLNARVSLATPEGVGLQSGQFIKGGTIVCTVGNSATSLVHRLAAPQEKGRLLTEADMRLRGSANVWAVGDCALVVASRDFMVSKGHPFAVR